MKTYLVTASVRLTSGGTIAVEAESVEQAIEKAQGGDELDWASPVWTEPDWEPEWMNAEYLMIEEVYDEETKLSVYY